MLDMPTVALAESAPPESGIIVEYVEDMPDIVIVTVDVRSEVFRELPPLLPELGPVVIDLLPY